jgi:hypothetical protein
MRLHRLALFAALSAAFHAILAVPIALVQAVERGVAFVFARLAPVAPADGSVRIVNVIDPPELRGQSIGPAVLNALRHEAGMRPLRC